MTVLQPWLENIPIRMQSTLLLSLRGPDTHRCPEIKKVQRWMRGLTFKPGNPENVREFMADRRDLPTIEEKGPLARELEFCTQHFYSHLMHGLEVIAYCYPNALEQYNALVLYKGMSQLFHLYLEPSHIFEQRLHQIEWPEGQPNNFEEAIAQIKE